jgi:hypothetical protein
MSHAAIELLAHIDRLRTIKSLRAGGDARLNRARPTLPLRTSIIAACPLRVAQIARINVALPADKSEGAPPSASPMAIAVCSVAVNRAIRRRAIQLWSGSNAGNGGSWR